MKYKLLYITADAENVETYYGFNEVIGIEQYKNAALRDKVIFRIDMLEALKDWFSEDILRNYRNLIYNIVSGKVRNKESISQVFTILYLEDKKFRVFLGEIVYFNQELQYNSLYRVLLLTIHNRIRCQQMYVSNELSKKNTKIIADSSCYLYVAVPDSNMTLTLPEGYRGEVVSRAKVWKGCI